MRTPALLLYFILTGGLAMIAGRAQTAAPTAPASVSPVLKSISPVLKDAAGRTLRRAATGHLTNYYEEKVPPYTLPEVLTLADGRIVSSADRWFKLRRPEILKLYGTEIYGRVPSSAPKVRFEVAEPNATEFLKPF